MDETEVREQLDLSADGTVLAASSWGTDGSQLTVYDTRDRSALANVTAPWLLHDVDVSPDGSRVAGLVEHYPDGRLETLLIVDVRPLGDSGFAPRGRRLTSPCGVGLDRCQTFFEFAEIVVDRGHDDRAIDEEVPVRDSVSHAPDRRPYAAIT